MALHDRGDRVTPDLASFIAERESNCPQHVTPRWTADELATR